MPTAQLLGPSPQCQRLPTSRLFIPLLLTFAAAAHAGVACDPSRIFADGFESADTLAWGGGSAAIAAARAAPDGATSIAVAGVVVTYIKPSIGSEPAGFFVQADRTGPALFVAVDPIGLPVVPVPGDGVHFRIDQMTTVGGQRGATAISDFGRTQQLLCLDGLTQNVSNVTDLVFALDSYESELITLNGTVTGSFGSSGTGLVAAPMSTAGMVGDPNLRLRLPLALQDENDVVAGCSFGLPGTPLWRFNATAMPSAWRGEDLTLASCPAPTVVTALATSPNLVTVTFDRRIAPASLAADGSQFVFNNGLTPTGASVTVRTATVATSTQTGGAAYTVSVLSSLTDLLGTGIGSPNQASFGAFAQPAQMVFNELNPNITGNHDLFELLVTGSGTTNGITIVQVGSTSQTLITMPDATVAAGDLIVVHLTPAGTVGIAPASETLSKSQYPNASFAANYDLAWDFLGEAVGLSFLNRVLRVAAMGGAILDAAPFVLSSSPTPPAIFPSDLQALQAAGLWLPPNCSGGPCTYVSTPTAIDVSVDYLGCGTTATGSSIARKAGFHTLQKSDWNAAGAQTWGAPNP